MPTSPCRGWLRIIPTSTSKANGRRSEVSPSSSSTSSASSPLPVALPFQVTCDVEIGQFVQLIVMNHEVKHTVPATKIPTLRRFWSSFSFLEKRGVVLRTCNECSLKPKSVVRIRPSNAEDQQNKNGVGPSSPSVLFAISTILVVKVW